MNSKEILATVRAHLEKQRVAAVGKLDGVCRYRITRPGEPVLKCAVGCLIPDDKYDHRMEPYLADALFTRFPEILTWVPTASQLKLLTELQMMHDRIEPVEWHTHLDAFEVKVNNGEYDDQPAEE